MKTRDTRNVKILGSWNLAPMLSAASGVLCRQPTTVRGVPVVAAAGSGTGVLGALSRGMLAGLRLPSIQEAAGSERTHTGVRNRTGTPC
ncbi:MAG: hypothetical protein GQ524_09700 [Anaerolineales bacterium]|nr:hypothetical protein [Anaerolineales bacterium]